ncbi:MAG: hypothetical protein ACC633_06095 [Anaerolineales bacterium]
MTKDLREYTRNTQNRLIFGFLVLVFLVGDGLIYIFYGKGAALVGLGCLVGALLPISLVVFFLWFTDWLVKNRKG